MRFQQFLNEDTIISEAVFTNGSGHLSMKAHLGPNTTLGSIMKLNNMAHKIDVVSNIIMTNLRVEGMKALAYFDVIINKKDKDVDFNALVQAILFRAKTCGIEMNTLG